VFKNDGNSNTFSGHSWVWSCSNQQEGDIEGNRPLLWILDREYKYTDEEVQSKIDSALFILEGYGYGQKSLETLRELMDISQQSPCDY